MHTTTLIATLVIAAAYLLAVRLVDFNEKEPLWAVAMLFVFGGLAAVGLTLAVDTAFLELEVVAGVLTKELARFLAFGAGFAGLFAVARSRGYSDINGLMDGVVYGAAGGLGFATGLAFAQQLLLPASDLPLSTQSVVGYGQIALGGLADGVFGALMGIGFAAALEARAVWTRAAAPALGYLVAAAGHLGYDWVAVGDPFGDGAALRKWVALLLPVALVAVVTVVALRSEGRAIAEELRSEADTGAVSAEELHILGSVGAREGLYFKTLLRGDLGAWTALHDLHNRQVQLALAKRKAAREKDEARRRTGGGEVARLRQAVFDTKRVLGRAPAAPPADEPPPPASPAGPDARPGGDDRSETRGDG
jgi:hypothetical protein